MSEVQSARQQTLSVVRLHERARTKSNTAEPTSFARALPCLRGAPNETQEAQMSPRRSQDASGSPNEPQDVPRGAPECSRVHQSGSNKCTPKKWSSRERAHANPSSGTSADGARRGGCTSGLERTAVGSKSALPGPKWSSRERARSNPSSGASAGVAREGFRSSGLERTRLEPETAQSEAKVEFDRAGSRETPLGRVCPKRAKSSLIGMCRVNWGCAGLAKWERFEVQSAV